MKFAEETYAKELLEELSRVAKANGRNENISMAGAGANWAVSAGKGLRLCKIHCFNSRGPEYLIDFRHGNEELAMGRTGSKETVVGAIAAWLRGDEVSALHSQFEFVDKQKRLLQRILTQLTIACPELQRGVTSVLRRQVCDLYELWFRAGDRSSRIFYLGKNTVPDAIFYWDDCRIFALQTADFGQLAIILNRWLSAQTKSSTLKKEFPFIDLDKVASYYEQGRGIEGEFIGSWDHIEQFYARMNFPPANDIRAFVAELRPRYEASLRAGQSIYSFILSRSRRHSLRPGQPHIVFQFRADGMEVCAEIEGTQKLSYSRIELTEELGRLLDQLVAQRID